MFTLQFVLILVWNQVVGRVVRIVIIKIDEKDQKKVDELREEIINEFDSILDVEGVEDAIMFLMNCFAYYVCW